MAANDAEGRNLLGHGQSNKTKAMKATERTSPFPSAPDPLLFKTLKFCIPSDLTEVQNMNKMSNRHVCMKTWNSKNCQINC